jgi:AP2-associated kinase
MFCQSPERIQVAQNEITILKQLPQHQNLVAYYGSSMIRNEQGVVVALILMEFCSGGSIFDLMAKNPNARLTENQIL